MTVSTATEKVLIYHIDPDDRLCEFNATWDEFAWGNDGEATVAERVLGHPLWEFVTDSSVLLLYKQIVQRARTGRMVHFQYRCDAPEWRRLFDMTIKASVDGDVIFLSKLCWDERRPTVALLDAKNERDRRWVLSCSWCQKIKLPNDIWVPVEEAVDHLGLLAEETLPVLTHGICPKCKAGMLSKLA